MMCIDVGMISVCMWSEWDVRVWRPSVTSDFNARNLLKTAGWPVGEVPRPNPLLGGLESLARLGPTARLGRRPVRSGWTVVRQEEREPCRPGPLKRREELQPGRPQLKPEQRREWPGRLTVRTWQLLSSWPRCQARRRCLVRQRQRVTGRAAQEALGVPVLSGLVRFVSDLTKIAKAADLVGPDRYQTPIGEARPGADDFRERAVMAGTRRRASSRPPAFAYATLQRNSRAGNSTFGFDREPSLGRVVPGPVGARVGCWGFCAAGLRASAIRSRKQTETYLTCGFETYTNKHRPETHIDNSINKENAEPVFTNK